MKLGKLKILALLNIVFSLIINSNTFADDKIETVPLINLEELSPTFEEGKDELEKTEEEENLNNNQEIVKKTKKTNKDKIYINIEALDKITAKTSSIRLAVGEKKLLVP